MTLVCADSGSVCPLWWATDSESAGQTAEATPPTQIPVASCFTTGNGSANPTMGACYPCVAIATIADDDDDNDMPRPLWLPARSIYR